MDQTAERFLLILSLKEKNLEEHAAFFQRLKVSDAWFSTVMSDSFRDRGMRQYSQDIMTFYSEASMLFLTCTSRQTALYR